MDSMETAATVYLLDDDANFVELIRSLFESVNLDFEGYESPQKFIQALPKMTSGCILLDMRLPGISGLDILDKITVNPASPPVIMVTGHADVEAAVRAMKSGAYDFIEKPFSGQALVDVVQKALKHDSANRGRLILRKTEADRVASLSRRERQVLDLVVQGKASKEIARELGISIHTVDNHRAHIMTKMNADSVADLVRSAVSANDLQSTVSGRPGKKL